MKHTKKMFKAELVIPSWWPAVPAPFPGKFLGKQRRNQRRFVCLFLALCLAVASQAFAQGGTWTTKAPMPTVRGALGAGVVNGIIYALGGVGVGTCCRYLTTNEAYDPATNTWTTRAPMSVGRESQGVGVVDGILYVVGGSVGCGLRTASVEAYDPAANTWTTKASMPAARAVHGVGVVNGILYAVGGIDCCRQVATVFAYNPATNTWSTKAPLPAPRSGLAVGVVNGILYAVGGTNVAGQHAASVEAYDPATNTWTTRAPMPTARTGHTVGVVNGILYAAGGAGATGVLATVEAYDPATNTWTTEAPMPTARTGLTVGVVNDTLYVLGKYGSCRPAPETLGTNEAFTPARQQNRPPVANAGPDQTVECTSPAGAQVRLDGSASSDPDGDPLSFLWRDAGGNVRGTTAIVNTTLPLNGHILTLTATDPGGLSGTDTAEVIVRDTRAPSISLPGPDPRMVIVQSVPAPRSALGLPAPTVSDVCDPAPQVTDNAPASFPTGLHTITFTARDRSGNSAQARLDVDVSLRFSFFDVFAEVELDDRELEMRSVFQLGPGNNGLDVARDRLRFQASGGLVNVSFELPLSAFRLRPNGRLTFEGMVSGLPTEIQIRPLGGGRFRIQTEIVGLSLSGLRAPLAVELRIGDDIGQTNARVEFD